MKIIVDRKSKSVTFVPTTDQERAQLHRLCRRRAVGRRCGRMSDQRLLQALQRVMSGITNGFS